MNTHKKLIEDDDAYRCCNCGIPVVANFRDCACVTALAFRRSGGRSIMVPNRNDIEEVSRDIAYLGEAQAHADEGPLGEPAARAILVIAIKYAVRARAAMDENPS